MDKETIARQTVLAERLRQALRDGLVAREKRYPFAKGMLVDPPAVKTALQRDVEQIVYILEQKRFGLLSTDFPLPLQAVENICQHFPEAKSILS